MKSRTSFRRRKVAWPGLCVATVLVILLSACSTFSRKSAVPAELRRDAVVVGLDIPNARFFRDQPALISAEQERALVREAKYSGVGRGGELPTAYLLALSGGGDNGAFGAGLLVGWTAHGDRPKFKIVTGVSTGSLIAPFAFLGPNIDSKLTEVYTTIDQSDVFEKRFITAALLQNAMAERATLRYHFSNFDERKMANRGGI